MELSHKLDKWIHKAHSISRVSCHFQMQCVPAVVEWQVFSETLTLSRKEKVDPQRGVKSSQGQLYGIALANRSLDRGIPRQNYQRRNAGQQSWNVGQEKTPGIQKYKGITVGRAPIEASYI